MAVVIYTAVNCGRDRVRPVLPNSSIRYVCFSDEPQAASGWEPQAMAYVHRDPARAARWYKMHPHRLFPDAAVSIWIDGNLHPQLPPDCDAQQFARWLLSGRDCATSIHPERDCIYDEAEACKRTWLDHTAVIDAQMARYRAEGVTPHAGLYETNLLVRRHTASMNQVNEAWWGENQRGSWRDQLSLPPVLKRLGMAMNGLPPGFSRHNPHFSFSPHPFRGHRGRRREHLDEISRRYGPNNPSVLRVARTLFEADAAERRWEQGYDRAVIGEDSAVSLG